MELWQIEIELKYRRRLVEYNYHVQQLEEQRKMFYEKNPDFPIKTMYMNVCAPPQRIIFKEINQPTDEGPEDTETLQEPDTTLGITEGEIG